MSTNDWEKSWKSQLDKYDSPVDSNLFEAITSKAAVKTGSPFLFGWIGLVVVISTALIIAGFNSKEKQNHLNSEFKSELLHAGTTENSSNLEFLSALETDPSVDYEMSNSGKYVLAKSNYPEFDIVNNSSTRQAKTTLDNSSAKKKSIQNLPGSSNINVAIAATETVYKEKANTLNAGLKIKNENEKSVVDAGLNINRPLVNVSYEDAKVRFNAAQPFSVLFPVKSNNKGLILDIPDPDNCFNDAKGRSSFYLDAYVGAGNSIRSLSAVEGQEIYRNMRDSLEKSWYNSAAGARIGFILSSGMAIETGAEYQVHNEIFEYKNESEVRITYKYHYDQSGSLTRIDTITEIGARTLRTHNKYQQITIPLRLGYTMEKGRWMLGARLGVGLHIWNHQHGVILDNTYQTYKIEDDPEKYFNKNWGMQYNASLQIGYRILPQTFLMIEPVWNSQSSGITKTPYTIEQKYQTLRLNVGIRFVPGSYY